MSKRMPRVNELLKREISNCVEKNFEFPDMLVTIHEVAVNEDLKSAIVFVGVIGSGSQKQKALDKLNHRRGFVQAQVMKRVVLRNTPRLEFRSDDSIERGVDLINLLDSLEETVPTDLDDPETGGKSGT